MLSSLLDLFRGRISLSIAFVILTLLAVGCAAGRWWWMGVRTQVEMVEYLRSRGFAFFYEWECAGDDGSGSPTEPYGPPFLVGLLGQDAFNRVARVYRDDSLSRVELNPKDIEAINYFSGARELALVNFTGDLKDLDLPQLRELSLSWGVVEEDAFGNFTRCPKLERLFLYDCILKGQAAARLGRGAQLTRVWCRPGSKDDRVLDMIDREATLKTLLLDGDDLTDDRLERATRHQSGLTYLNLSQCQLSDDGMKHVARCTELQHLTLDAPRVTPAGLGRLRGLTKLEHLNLYLSGASSEWVQAIKQLVPHLKSLDIGNQRVDLKANPPKLNFLLREEVEELEAAGIKVGNG